MDRISRRTCPWLSEEQIALLQSHDIRTFMDFITAERNFVTTAAGFNFAEYEVTLLNITECIRPAPITATQLVSQALDQLYSTGVQKLDEILSGGLAGGETLEIYGKYRTGKTQLCLAIAAQFCHFRKEKLTVVYFDLKNDFRATRFLSFCEGVEIDLANIQIVRPSTFPELIFDIDELKNNVSNVVSDFYLNLKLVIFDSIPMAIYPAVNEDPISWRFHQEQFVEKVAQMAQLNKGIIVIYVNHSVSARSDQKLTNPGARFSGPSISSSKPAMGKYWLHKPNFRLQVSEHPNSTTMFNAILEKSSRTETMKAFDFSIGKDGIESY